MQLKSIQYINAIYICKWGPEVVYSRPESQMNGCSVHYRCIQVQCALEWCPTTFLHCAFSNAVQGNLGSVRVADKCCASVASVAREPFCTSCTTSATALEWCYWCPTTFLHFAFSNLDSVQVARQVLCHHRPTHPPALMLRFSLENHLFWRKLSRFHRQGNPRPE